MPRSMTSNNLPDLSNLQAGNEPAREEMLDLAFVSLLLRYAAPYGLECEHGALTQGALHTNPARHGLGYARFGGELRLVHANPHFCDLLKSTRSELMGRRFCELFKVRDQALRREVPGAIGTELMWANVALNSRDGGEPETTQMVSVWRRTASDELESVVVFLGELGLREAENENLLGVGVDRMTGLLGAAAFRRELERAVNGFSSIGGFAVLHLSLDRFQTFNAMYGRARGDLALAEVARRLGSAVDWRGVVARLRADEFGVIFEVEDGKSHEAFADRLIKMLGQPIAVEAEDVVLSLSAGLCIYPDHGSTADAISNGAEIAWNHVKRHGGGGLAVFSEQLAFAAWRRVEIDRSLRKALMREEFEIEYQPRVELSSMEVVAMEALVRWNHPELGRVQPLDFIPIAEEKGLISEIGRWVLHSACTFARDLMRRHERGIRVSVNISAQQLQDVRILDDIAGVLAQTGLPAELLELELTESLLVEDHERCAEILRRLKSLGVALSIDDFGTGYSSLAYLQLFPVDAIKLDKTFVNCEGGGATNLRLVKAMVELAHALDLQVVAEGVEGAEILRFLHDSGCDEVQGYLVSRPIGASTFAHFLDAYVPNLDHVSKRAMALT